MDCQDWEPTRISGTAAVATARAAARGPKVTVEVAHARKIAAADGPVKLKQLAPESRHEIVQKRVAMKKTQVELNQLCGFAPHTIRDIEAGKLTPSPGQLNTLNRVLKASLKMV